MCEYQYHIYWWEIEPYAEPASHDQFRGENQSLVTEVGGIALKSVDRLFFVSFNFPSFFVQGSTKRQTA